MASVLRYLILIAHFLRTLFRRKHEQALIELALRQQLDGYHRARPRPRLAPIDRPFWVTSDRPTHTGGSDAAIQTLDSESINTAYRCPWQNAYAERWIGTYRRELLDHVVVVDERHLKRLLTSYVGYYNADRVHRRTRDAPSGRPTEPRLSSAAQVIPCHASPASSIATRGRRRRDRGADGFRERTASRVRRPGQHGSRHRRDRRTDGPSLPAFSEP